MKNRLGPGLSINLPVPYAGGVTSGQGVLVGGLFAIASVDAAQNIVIACEREGEYLVTKEPALAIANGARVFWDNTNRRVTTTATANVCIGCCTTAALAGDASVRIVLTGSTPAGT